MLPRKAIFFGVISAGTRRIIGNAIVIADDAVSVAVVRGIEVEASIGLIEVPRQGIIAIAEAIEGVSILPELLTKGLIFCAFDERAALENRPQNYTDNHEHDCCFYQGEAASAGDRLQRDWTQRTLTMHRLGTRNGYIIDDPWTTRVATLNRGRPYGSLPASTIRAVSTVYGIHVSISSKPSPTDAGR